jgi:ribonuclease D
MAAETDWIWVDNAEKRQEAAQDIASSPWIALDTEYDSFRYFRDKLCLIQVKTPSMTYLLDPLDGSPPNYLARPFASRQTLKVFHAGDNDIRLLHRDYGFTFRNVFDTYRAATLLGYKNLSLAALVEECLGIPFPKRKKVQRSNWDARPLTEEQLFYAAEDTLHLLPLCRRLEAEIAARGLEREARQSFREIAAARWQERPFRPEGYRRVQGVWELTPEERERLKRIYAWRWWKSKQMDRSPFMLLSSQEMLALARLRGSSVEAIKRSGVLSPERTGRYGPELARALRDSGDPDTPGE